MTNSLKYNKLNSTPKYTALFAILLLLFLPYSNTFAAELKGQITNSETGEPLVGVNVILPEHSFFGSSTNLDGQYRITNLPAGTYNIKVSMLGYQTREIESVIVNVQSITVLDIQLTSQIVTLQPVVFKMKRPSDLVSSENRVSGDIAGILPVKALAFREITGLSFNLTMKILTGGKSIDNRDGARKVRQAKILMKYHVQRSLDLLNDVVINHSHCKVADEALYLLIRNSGLIQSKEYYNLLKRDYPESQYIAPAEGFLQNR